MINDYSGVSDPSLSTVDFNPSIDQSDDSGYVDFSAIAQWGSVVGDLVTGNGGGPGPAPSPQYPLPPGFPPPGATPTRQNQLLIVGGIVLVGIVVYLAMR